MDHLTFPFEEQGTLLFRNNSYETLGVHTEVAKSKIELFQSLNYREKKEDFNPLTLVFENPNMSYQVSFNYQFDIDVIHVDHQGVVVKTYSEQANLSKSQYVKLFSGLQMVIICPQGFVEDNNIITQFMFAELASGVPHEGVYFRSHAAREYKLKSDRELIKIFNAKVNADVFGFCNGIDFKVLVKEMFKRSFDSSVIIHSVEDSKYMSCMYTRKVKLVKNKLELK